CNRECAETIATTMQLEGPRSTAAVFLEPAAGSNGVLVPPPDYWPIVRKACDAEGTLLVADEVLTGFGRTGKAFAHQHWGVVPDLITVAKGMASGYATIGAVIVHERVAKYFDERVLACGLTYYAHPVSCAAAVAALKVYEEDRLVDAAAALSPVLRRELEAVAARIAAKSFVRVFGLLAALEVEATPEQWAVLGKELAARRLSLHVDPKRGMAIFSPPLCISETELVNGMRGFSDAAVAAFGARE